MIKQLVIKHCMGVCVRIWVFVCVCVLCAYHSLVFFFSFLFNKGSSPGYKKSIVENICPSQNMTASRAIAAMLVGRSGFGILAILWSLCWKHRPPFEKPWRWGKVTLLHQGDCPWRPTHPHHYYHVRRQFRQGAGTSKYNSLWYLKKNKCRKMKKKKHCNDGWIWQDQLELCKTVLYSCQRVFWSSIWVKKKKCINLSRNHLCHKIT